MPLLGGISFLVFQFDPVRLHIEFMLPETVDGIHQSVYSVISLLAVERLLEATGPAVSSGQYNPKAAEVGREQADQQETAAG